MDAEVTLIAALEATVEVLPALDADVTLVVGGIDTAYVEDDYVDLDYVEGTL